MFEDDELTFSTKKICNFCGKEIKYFPAMNQEGTLKFCDLICAKLYYDNVERFRFDMKKYNNYFNEGELSKKARDIFERCRFVLFEQLPVYRPLEGEEAFNNPELMYKIYNKILSPVLFKSIGAYE